MNLCYAVPECLISSIKANYKDVMSGKVLPSVTYMVCVGCENAHLRSGWVLIFVSLCNLNSFMFVVIFSVMGR